VKGSTYTRPNAHDHISMMLVRWLLFRMMFASGVVKLTSGCPTWWSLTALPLHYESQCIPTPLAWWQCYKTFFFFTNVVEKGARISPLASFFIRQVQYL